MDDFELNLYEEGKMDYEMGVNPLCNDEEYLRGYGDAYAAQEQLTALIREPMEN
jgi:hypothetical protein